MSNVIFDEGPEPLASAGAAVFIDQNGTLIDELPDGAPTSAIQFRDGALDAINTLAAQGLAIVVVTSAPSLGLGLVTRSALAAVEQALRSRVREATGVSIAGFYTCPHKPAEGGQPACLCRVPAPGLLRQAAASLRLQLERCWVVGDMLNDVEAGRRVGARTILVDSGSERQWRLSPLRTPHHRVKSLVEAAEVIKQAPPVAADLDLQIALRPGITLHHPSPFSGHADRRPVGPLRPYEPHPTREWL